MAKRGPNRVNAVQMCLFDAQLSLEAVERALSVISNLHRNDLRSHPAVQECYHIVSERRKLLREHNAELARLLAS